MRPWGTAFASRHIGADIALKARLRRYRDYRQLISYPWTISEALHKRGGGLKMDWPVWSARQIGHARVRRSPQKFRLRPESPVMSHCLIISVYDETDRACDHCTGSGEDKTRTQMPSTNTRPGSLCYPDVQMIHDHFMHLTLNNR
jgi:hypothetical protein